MNTLISVAIAPFGQGDELAEYVAQVIEVIRESGLPYQMNSMFTEIEGPWDEVMQTVKDATFVLAEQGIRTEVVLKADIRPGRTNTMSKKVASVNRILNEQGAEDAK
ncbi:MTH1187 family thiamine-binding protein [Vibrio zhugei]|uniref:MTH1187 family thiamine-binding protein n=1 Tax=Vibrio zhugei TaxID=2479546 RepID=A0ABV7CDE5_9VIBR|nr:MTH1187 family thiamine-binding protein [Vibrio zhugei]